MLREGWFQQNNPSTVTFVRDITLGRTFKSDKQNVKYPFPVFSKPFNKSLIAAFWFLILSIFFSIFGWPQSFPINVICFYNTHHALVVLVNGTFDILNILLSKSWNIWYCLWLIHWMLYTVYMGPMRKNGSWDGTQLPSQQKTWFLSQSCSFNRSLPSNIHPRRGLNILFSSCSESFVTFLWFFRAPSWINESSHWLHIRAGNSETRQTLYLCQCRHEPHFRWLVTPVTQHYVNTFLANVDSKKYVLLYHYLNTVCVASKLRQIWTTVN